MNPKQNKSLLEALAESKGNKSWKDVKAERSQIDPKYIEAIETQAQERLRGVGDVVKIIRLEARFNQRELAAHAEINQSVLSRLEANLTDPNFGTISRLLDVMGWRLAAINGQGACIPLGTVFDEQLLFRGTDPPPPKSSALEVDALFTTLGVH